MAGTLEARVAALETKVAALVAAGRDETLQPTYLTVNPATGTVGAVFPGGVQVSEVEQNTGFQPDEGISWLDFSGSGIVREQIWGGTSNADAWHWLNVYVVSDLENFAGFQMHAEVNGGAGTSEIDMLVGDSVDAVNLMLMRSDGASYFLQAPSMSLPARVVNTVYTPNATHATLITVTANVQATAAFYANVALLVNGAQVAICYIGAGTTQNEYLSMTALVPAGGTYEIATASGGAGTITNLHSVTEWQL